MFCSKCGSQLITGASFCASCGAQVLDTSLNNTNLPTLNGQPQQTLAEPQPSPPATAPVSTSPTVPPAAWSKAQPATPVAAPAVAGPTPTQSWQPPPMAPNENLSAAPAASTQKKGRGKKIALIVIAIVLAVGLLPTLMTSIINARTVPDVVGMTTTEAAGVISNEGFKVSYIDREGKSLNSYETEGGKVVAQQPEAQAGAKKNDTIVLTVMRLITVPDVIGNTVSEAENKLAHLQIDLANADAIGDKNAWQITEQSLLPNSQVFEDEPIVLSATDKSIVPNAIGMKADEAKILLSHNGLKYEITSDTGKLVVLDDNWVVISQSTEPNTELAVGTVVFLTVSKNSSSTQGITAADIQVSAIDLAQIYMNAGNQVQYEGKLIEVTGEVYSVEVVDSASTDGFVEGLLSDIGNAVFGDTYAVRLVGGTVGYRQVFVDCYDMPSNQLSSLSPGSTVTIIGRCSGNSEHVNITDSIIKP